MAPRVHITSFRSPARATTTALLGSLVASAALLTLVRWAGLPATGGPASTEEVLLELMVWAAVALSGWLGLGSVLAVGAALPGAVGAACEAAARWLTPRLLRQGVAIAIGTAVATVSLPVGPASGTRVTRGAAASPPEEVRATPADPATPHAGTAPSPAFVPTRDLEPSSAPVVSDVPASLRADGASRPPAPSPGWRPTRPAPVVDADQSRLLAPSPRTAAALDASVTVRRGDSLWSIAARHLGPGAGDAAIAHAWPRWYAANRDVIGVDPDQLVPGQQLRPPALGETP